MKSQRENLPSACVIPRMENSVRGQQQNLRASKADFQKMLLSCKKAAFRQQGFGDDEAALPGSNGLFKCLFGNWSVEGWRGIFCAGRRGIAASMWFIEAKFRAVIARKRPARPTRSSFQTDTKSVRHVQGRRIYFDLFIAVSAVDRSRDNPADQENAYDNKAQHTEIAGIDEVQRIPERAMQLQFIGDQAKRFDAADDNRHDHGNNGDRQVV
jgi:hypothetical protein